MRGAIPFALLAAVGISWGFTQPLSKIAVSTGYQPFGLIFWQSAIGALLLGGFVWFSRQKFSLALKIWPYYIAIALIGTVIPNAFSYYAITVVPSGIMSILLSLVPILAFPIAIALRNDHFSWTRFYGLLLGLGAVILIIGVPEALPNTQILAFIPFALIAPLCYAFEGNFVARWGTGGANPVQLLLGASVVGAILSLPLAVLSGEWITPFVRWGAAEWAIVGSAVIHAVVYATYIMLVRLYGPVFSVQTGYIVTISGVVWAIVLLNEWYSGPVWAALLLLLVGVYLVSPKPVEPSTKVQH